MRQIVLDTETTGLDVERGHRIIEIGCVELVNRRRTEHHWHRYLLPDREIDEAAADVHGISSQMLADKPRFGDVMDEFLDFIDGAELIIHNAEFDIGFLDRELELARPGGGRINDICTILDSLLLARQIHPGQRNSLDALCRRYGIDNSGRDLHGALLDAQLLADVYLVMTGGQGSLSLDHDSGRVSGPVQSAGAARIDRDGLDLVVVSTTRAEQEAHERQLDLIEEACPDGAVWRRPDA